MSMTLLVKVFDVLMVNGTSLAQKSLRRRKEVLGQNRIFKPIAGRFELADLWDGSSADDIDMRLKDIVGTK
jgi:ATP-dependent DNA ligase